MRIAICGIVHESCTFSPLPTHLEDFSILRGAELRDQLPFLNQWTEPTFVPLMLARALPGGVVDAEAYDHLKTEIFDGLQSFGPWDGIYLAMHGALYVSGMEDVEGHFIAEVRKIVGPVSLISASYDLHGNVSQHIIDNLDILTAYRTAPHVDLQETNERACRLLVHCIHNRIRPYKVFIPIPITLPGERAMTTAEPGLSLYARIPNIVNREGILDASILIGYTWADEPRVGASVICLGTDTTEVQQAARELASAFWQVRHDFDFSMVTGTTDECIEMALNESESGVFISDAGDNLTGGGVGDVPYVLGRLLHYQVPDALFAQIIDPQAVAQCQRAGVGEKVSLMVGGKLDPIHGSPLNVKGRVLKLKNIDGNNMHVILQIEGVKLILTENRTAFTRDIEFKQLDLHPENHAITVVKLGYLFPELKPLANKSLLAFSPGAINPDITQLPFHRIRRPIFPLDHDMDWQQ
jgi:microcystin degradation protein MlrC